MEAKHQELVNAKFLELVLKEVKKQHPEIDVEKLDKKVLLDHIKEGANLNMLKVIITQILINQDSKPHSPRERNRDKLI